MGIEDYEDVTYRLNPGDIASAREGDYLAAERLMDLFARTVEADKPLAPELLGYFAVCFRQIFAGADPASALHIKPKGRPRDPEKWLRDVELALAVEELREAGATVEEAVAKVSEGDPKKESTVRRAYLDYGTGVFAPPENRAVDKKKNTSKKRTDTFKK